MKNDTGFGERPGHLRAMQIRGRFICQSMHQEERIGRNGSSTLRCISLDVSFVVFIWEAKHTFRKR